LSEINCHKIMKYFSIILRFYNLNCQYDGNFIMIKLTKIMQHSKVDILSEIKETLHSWHCIVYVQPFTHVILQENKIFPDVPDMAIKAVFAVMSVRVRMRYWFPSTQIVLITNDIIIFIFLVLTNFVIFCHL